MSLIDIVSSYISRHGLLDKQSLYVVALSGGADSVALLLMLQELGYQVEAAHCNFHLRGDEANRDEAFAKELCARCGVPFHVVHFDTHAYASLHKVSIEMAARRLRYAYFEQLRRDIGAAAICVAHHRNDNVETVLMNLVRGTGIHGLVGIRPQNGNVVRPLLCISRDDIEAYLHSKGQVYVTDSTNLVPDVLRNKIRLKLIPMLMDINSNAVDNIQRTSEYISEAVKVYDESVQADIAKVKQDEEGRTVIDIRRLTALVSPEAVLHDILKDYGFTPLQVVQIYANIHAPTGRIMSSSSHDLAFDRGRIIISTRKAPMPSMDLPEPGTYIYAGTRKLRIERQDIEEGFHIPRKAFKVCIDADKVKFPLALRPVQVGDRFVPFGMNGSKLISDYLTDRKKDIFQKKEQLVITDATGMTVWLVGERTDNRCRITTSTTRALLLSFSEVHEFV